MSPCLPPGCAVNRLIQLFLPLPLDHLVLGKAEDWTAQMVSVLRLYQMRLGHGVTSDDRNQYDVLSA